MKIYLCRKCNRVVPMADLLSHREQCGPDSEITLKKSTTSRIGAAFRTAGALLLAILLGVAAILLGSSSFSSIAAMRKLERIPATVINAVLPGEINLNGKALKLNQALRAPKSGVECLYYRYLVERQERDSDGDTKWVTVSDDSDFVDFQLSDATGAIVVRPDSGVDFSLPKSFTTRSGNYRYSEWRIDPGASLFIFGYVVESGTNHEVRFNRDGEYLPIISGYGEEKERRGMAAWSVGKCWGGLVALAFCASIIISLLKIHRLLVYFAILSMLMLLDLTTLGLKMMKTDLRGAAGRLVEHEAAAGRAIRAGLERMGVRWEGDWESLGELSPYRGMGLAEDTIVRLNRVRLDYARAVERVRRQRNAFPERILAPVWSIPSPAPVPLPASAQRDLDAMIATFRKARFTAGAGWGIIAGSFLVAAVSFVCGFRRVRFKRCMENIPTSPTKGAVYGLSEFKGIVALPESEEPLRGPLSMMPCIEYHYQVKERRGSGKKARWVTVIDERNCRPFLCTDAEGSILVDPSGARTITDHKTTRREGRRRYIETRLEINDPLYAIGECAIEPVAGDSLYLKKPEGDYPFILSNCTESRVMRKLATAGIALLNISFSAVLLMALVLFGLSGSFAATDYLSAALVAPVFMTLVTLVLHFNDLIFLRERANRNWSNIDVSLQKRHDLIPNLEAVVKTYMAHEARVQESLTAMRSAYGAAASRSHEAVAAFMASEHDALSRVLATFEDYPDLKANRESALLMRTLVILENEIAFMRTGYNKAVETFNTRIESFPDILFAKLFGFGSKDYIRAESEAIAIPPSIQTLWERDPAEGMGAGPDQQTVSGTDEESGAVNPSGGAPLSALAATAMPGVGSSQRVSEDLSEDAIDARAVIYALLLNADEATRAEQLSAIASMDSEQVSQRTAALIEAVSQEIKDDVSRLLEAEEWFDKLKSMSLEGYRAFSGVVRRLMEQDSEISLFEYALQKSISCRLDPVFGLRQRQPVRHRDLGMVLDPVSLLLSRLACSEEQPGETGQAAFDAGVALLNHQPKSDLKMVAADQCTIARYDAALEELSHAASMVQSNLLYACGEAVKMNNDYTYDQALLLIAMADSFMKERPAWLLPEQH